ncbi:voltage-gated hydrogen channel 1-like isoform X2 [Apostichopus japonicus]|uniref:voltage-gated hydrogen channel 1-like isoform X2 n=1 Tax=Stichopus japonicus TaxID=307972 RepID=UPI003AB61255
MMDKHRIEVEDTEMFGFRRLSDPKSTSFDPNRVIVKDDSSDSVVSDSAEDGPRHKPANWREKLQSILRSQQFQILVVVLVILDCIFVIGELILDFQALSDAQTPTTTSGDQSVVRSENLRISETNALSDKEAKELTAAEVLHAMSLSIVSLFMIEISVKIIAFGLDFFKSKLEVFDAIVVIISFVLDVLSLVLEEQFAALQLLILLRLWRIVRVINGVILSVETNAEKKIEAQKRLREELELELEKFRRYCSAQEKEIEMLRNELQNHGISIDDGIALEKPSYLKNRLDVVVEVNNEFENGRETDLGSEFTQTLDSSFA